MNEWPGERLPPEMAWSERAALESLESNADEHAPDAAPCRNTLLVLQGALARLPGHTIGPFGLELAPGERIAILGPSGAGKSTLLKLMAGERGPDAGDVLLEGRSLRQWARPALARRRAVLPQSHAVAFGLPVELVVALGRVAREPDPSQSQVVGAALQLAQVAHLALRRFDTLSGGEQARVQLARVFAQLWDEREALVLVDEPLAALDPGLQFELMDAMQRFARERGHALVAVLHDINQALAGFDRLWLLRQGRLVADLPSDRDAIAQLEALYGIELRCAQDAAGELVVVARRAHRRDNVQTRSPA